MISYLKGKITRQPTGIIVEAGGVGYDVIVNDPAQFSEHDPEKAVLIRQVITETSSTLYGFPDEEHRELFDLLTKYVSGIGPKSAHTIIGRINPKRFKTAVAENDLACLSAIKGIGSKTAERILIELRDKVKIADLWKESSALEDKAVQETILALMALGFTRSNADKAAKDARKALPETQDTRELTRAALKQ